MSDMTISSLWKKAALDLARNGPGADLTEADWTPDPSRTVHLDEDDGRPLEPGWTLVTPTHTRSLRRIR